MITITKQNDGVLFAFQDSDKYLYGNGSILVPFNTLSIVADESDMITLKKAASNDVFISARYDTDLGYRSKDDAIDDLKDLLFAETGGGGSESGITSGEVQTMIDNSLEDYYTDDEVDAALSGKADASALTSHADNANVHFSGTQKSNYDGLEAQYYVDNSWDIMSMNVFNDFTNDYSAAMGQFDQRISANTSAIATKADTSAVTAVANDVQTVSGQVQTKVATSDFNAYSAATATALGNKQDALVYYSENTEDGWAEMRVATDDGEGSTGDNHINIGGGVAEIGIYNEYDDGQGNVTSNNTSIYADQTMVSLQAGITEDGDTTSTEFSVEATGVTINGDAVATEPYVDAAISGKVDTSAITTAITSGSTNSEIPTAKATYDAIQAGGGGGATYSAGTNISIDTANTINCTLPIETVSNSYGVRQIYVGNNIYKNNTYGAIVIANKDDASTGETRVEYAENAISIGSSNKVFHNGIAIGKNATAGAINSWGNIAIGSNVTASGSTKTNINNQIKVDTNNQVYIKDKTNTTDVCIQDAIAALGGLKLVKLTQSEYDQLATKDPDTLYIISNVVS